MYLPPLFPTLLRTTVRAFATTSVALRQPSERSFFGLFAKVGDFRVALFSVGFLIQSQWSLR
jgi:hypothetical protein